MSMVRLSDLTAPPEHAQKQLSGRCPEHGDYVVDAFYLSGKLHNPDPACPRCVISESKKSAKAQYEKMRFGGVDRMLDHSQISPRMMNCQVQNFEPVNSKAKAYKKICQQFVEDWRQKDSQRRNLIMVGDTGTGKTHLGTAIALAIIRGYAQQALYTRADDLATFIRGAYGDGATYSEDQAIKRYGEAPLLILDELGATAAKDHERSLLSRVIDIRWLNFRPTIMMSNLTIAELESATDERMMRRLRDGATVMIFDWESYRSQVQP